jgi:hypothetical protein
LKLKLTCGHIPDRNRRTDSFAVFDGALCLRRIRGHDRIVQIWIESAWNSHPQRRLSNAQVGEKLSSSGCNSVDSRRLTLKTPTHVIVLVFALATVVYTMQLFTPLRLTTDGISYLSFADSAVRANGLTTIAKTYFLLPKGYPLLLFAMMRTGGFVGRTRGFQSDISLAGVDIQFSDIDRPCL